MHTYDKTKAPLYQLAEIGEILRCPTGCPWDREQTHESMKSSLIEEAYEMYEAIESGDLANLQEEMGDLLYQIYAHAQIEAELGNFSIDDVALGITNKLVNRHPHVFGEDSVKDSAQVLRNWEAIKKKEKAERKSIMDGIPGHLPALLKAFRMQEKAHRVGFDWEKPEDAMSKLDEELNELKEAVKEKDQEHIKEEAGDILFSIVNVLRLMKIDPEDALQVSAEKFRRRFGAMEEDCRQTGRAMESMTLHELDALWQKVKPSVQD